MREIFCFIILVAVIIYAAFTDYKRREIENVVPIIILIVGVISIFTMSEESVYYVPLYERILGFILISCFMFPNSKLKIGGGDMKLIASMTFTYGLFGTFVILVGTIPFMLIYSYLRKKKEKDTKGPLATLMAVPYIMYNISLLVF